MLYSYDFVYQNNTKLMYKHKRSLYDFFKIFFINFSYKHLITLLTHRWTHIKKVC